MFWKETKSGIVLNLLDGVEPQIADLKVSMFKWQYLEFIKYIMETTDIGQQIKMVNPKTSGDMYLAIIFEITNSTSNNKRGLPIDSESHFIRLVVHKIKQAEGKMIINKIKEDYKQARKDHNKELAGKLGALLSEIQKAEKDQQTETLTDSEIIKILMYFKKGATQNYETTGADKYQKEIGIYNKYLPKPMTEAEIDQALGLFLGLEVNADIGKCMAHFKKNYAGRYDPKELQKKIKKIL